jgi:hypothetical protein
VTVTVAVDVKTSLMELHDLGPCKLFDTAGLDEPGELGAKKRAKVCQYVRLPTVIVTSTP